MLSFEDCHSFFISLIYPHFLFFAEIWDGYGGGDGNFTRYSVGKSV